MKLDETDNLMIEIFSPSLMRIGQNLEFFANCQFFNVGPFYD